MHALLADTTNPSTIFDYIQSGGLIGLFIIILWGGIKKWWVFGWQYNELKERQVKMGEELNGWKELALRSTNLAESLQEVSKAKAMP